MRGVWTMRKSWDYQFMQRTRSAAPPVDEIMALLPAGVTASQYHQSGGATVLRLSAEATWTTAQLTAALNDTMPHNYSVRRLRTL